MNHYTIVPNKNAASTVLVGHISKAHGVKGEVALVLHAESSALLCGEVFLQKDPASPLRPIVIEKTRAHHGGLLVTFAHVRDRNAETSSVTTTPRIATATTLPAAMKLARKGGAAAPMKIVP